MVKAKKIKLQLPSNMTIFIHTQYETWNDKEEQRIPCYFTGTCLNQKDHESLTKVFNENQITLRYVETVETILDKAKNQRKLISEHVNEELECVNMELECADEHFEKKKQKLEAKIKKLKTKKRNYVRLREKEEERLTELQRKFQEDKDMPVTVKELCHLGLNMTDLIEASETPNSFSTFMTTDNMRKI